MSVTKLKKAKKLYMAYHSVSECARQANLPRSTISSNVKKEGGWEYERDLLRTELLSQVTASRAADFANMTSATIVVLTRALQSLAKREDAPTVSEAKSAASILDVLDKITRLDAGTPTDIITEEKVVTVGELQKRISVDPFAKEVQYKEIEDE